MISRTGVLGNPGPFVSVRGPGGLVRPRSRSGFRIRLRRWKRVQSAMRKRSANEAISIAHRLSAWEGGETNRNPLAEQAHVRLWSEQLPRRAGRHLGRSAVIRTGESNLKTKRRWSIPTPSRDRSARLELTRQPSSNFLLHEFLELQRERAGAGRQPRSMLQERP